MLIAVIDDDLPVIDYARLFLEEEGYAVAGWQTESDVLAFLHETGPDIVVLDLHMEQRDAGIAILESLRADLHLRSLPVILSSAQHQFTAKQQDRLAELRYDFLPKPYRGGTLLSAIQRAISPHA